MDADLKARLVTTEELSLAVSAHLRKLDHRAPVVWWDRSCDVSLLIGTFVHGLGNYEAMQNDDVLPFSFKIQRFTKADEACAAAQASFRSATVAARNVFDDALESAKAKAQEEVHAAVAAAAAASLQREQDALAMRQGGAAAAAVVSSMAEPPEGKPYEFDGNDSHFVTLPRLKDAVLSTLRKQSSGPGTSMDVDEPTTVTSGADESGKEESSKRKNSLSQYLPMPDARVLDYRLSVILAEIERNAYPDEEVDMDADFSPSGANWPSTEEVSTNVEVRTRALSYIACASNDALEGQLCEYMGIGINGTQCAALHRSLDDGTDFSIGAASVDLAQVAYGSDAPRYLRAIGVPMNLTRFAVASLVHADDQCVQYMMSNERARNHRNMENAVDTLADEKEIPEPASPDAKESTEPANPGAKENTESTSPGTIKKDELPPPAVKKEEMESASSAPATITPQEEEVINTTATMPTVFESNAKLRASVCVTVLHFGYPFLENQDIKVHKPLWTSIREQSGLFDDVTPESLFHAEQFRAKVQQFAEGVEVPDSASIRAYVEEWFLPHCLRVCLNGNGPTTRNARGSKGEFETAFGTSMYPEYADRLQSPIPDPCLWGGEQSLEAVATAFAILRRVRIMRSALYIASGNVPMTQLDGVLHSSFMRKSMEGLPVWWCPWIHDAALLLHASTRGLFDILRDRDSEENTSIAFSHKAITRHMYSTFVAEENVLPRSIVDDSPPEDVTKWIEIQAREFPSANALERRLAFLCAKATENVGGEKRYDNLPMFDHGGWPRN
jgi:hypothetical protein